MWFCLPHVREYNASWDYYKGMSPQEIEANLRHDSGWHRPTWPLGRLGASRRLSPEFLRDPLGMLHEGRPPQARRRGDARRRSAPPELRAALDVLGLEWPVDERAVRSRYKELAKRFHPDVNGGDRERGGEAEGCQPRLQPAAPAPRHAAARGGGGGGGRPRRPEDGARQGRPGAVTIPAAG